jgi:hypothetical protein
MGGWELIAIAGVAICTLFVVTEEFNANRAHRR